MLLWLQGLIQKYFEGLAFYANAYKNILSLVQGLDKNIFVGSIFFFFFFLQAYKRSILVSLGGLIRFWCLPLAPRFLLVLC